MLEKPIYVSPCTAKSLWQEYCIYPDRIELKTHLGTLVVPFSAVESVRVSESDLKGLMRGELQLKNFRPALKLDWANFVEHVVIDKSEGKIRRILFTPDDPAGFKEALDKALARK
ncbi:MAG: hypothetical protein ABII79_01015 [bacterium]